MAIGTVDALIAGQKAPVSWLKAAGTGEAAGERWSPIFTTGNPGAATVPTGLNGTALTTLTGALTVPAAVSGDYTELVAFEGQQGGSVGGIWLVDLLWWNGSIVATTTTNQAITHPGIPARDRAASSNGDGVFLGILVSTVTGNGGAITNMTATYTDSSGNTAQTATVTSFPITAVAGHVSLFNLAAGDVGVRSVEGITLGTSLVSGVVHLFQYRPIAYIPLTAANIGNAMTAGQMRRVWDSSCLALIYDLTGTAIGQTSGMLTYSQG